MASTGHQIVTSGTVVDDAAKGQWTSSGNITADDGAFARLNVAAGQTGETLLAEIDLSGLVPASATVDGLEWIIHGGANGTDLGVHTAQLYIGSSFVGDAYDCSTSGAGTGGYDFFIDDVSNNTDYTVGSSSDSWGVSLTGSDLSSCGLSLIIVGNAGAARIARIDYISVDTTYTVAGGGPRSRSYRTRGWGFR